MSAKPGILEARIDGKDDVDLTVTQQFYEAIGASGEAYKRTNRTAERDDEMRRRAFREALHQPQAQ